MKFTAKTESQLKDESLIPEGTELKFEVIKAEDKMSKSGNEMIALKINLYDNGVSRGIIFDYLLEAMQFKLLHFCNATGLSEKYNSGELTAIHCENRTGACIIGIQKAKGDYPAKNTIKDYIVDTQPMTDDDDIPF